MRLLLSAIKTDRGLLTFISRMSRGDNQRQASCRRRPRLGLEYKHTVAMQDHQPRSEGPGGIVQGRGQSTRVALMTNYSVMFPVGPILSQRWGRDANDSCESAHDD
jgi:hypothetical protein